MGGVGPRKGWGFASVLQPQLVSSCTCAGPSPPHSHGWSCYFSSEHSEISRVIADSLRLDSSAIPNLHPGPHLTSLTIRYNLSRCLHTSRWPRVSPSLCRRADRLCGAHFSAEGLLLRNSAFVAARQPRACDRPRENDSFCRPDFPRCSVPLSPSYTEAEMRRFKSQLLSPFHLPAAIRQERYVNFFFLSQMTFKKSLPAIFKS